MCPEFDTILVGGGLQNALVALALGARRARATWALVERGPRLGGNHTWCFHAGDIDAESLSWVAPLVVARWPGYEVRFPSYTRHLDNDYSMLTSDHLHTVLERAAREQAGCRLYTNRAATDVGADGVTLENGERLTGEVVVDARGIATPVVAQNGSRRDRCGYQKFVGLELELAAPHALHAPILMDATVEQHDGFRFVYTLPIGPRRLLVEDTYFANDPALARETLRHRIHAYVAGMGLQVTGVVREEEGVLPMPWHESAPDSMWPPALPGADSSRGPLLAGHRGGFFHPGTGYSLPVAVRLAELVASTPPEHLFGPRLQAFVRAHRRQARFCHLLNHMLFRWFPPDERWHVFRRFYGLPLDTIERYYALRLRPVDRARLVLGRPPRGMSLRYRLLEGAAR